MGNWPDELTWNIEEVERKINCHPIKHTFGTSVPFNYEFSDSRSWASSQLTGPQQASVAKDALADGISVELRKVSV
jgi:hypothetical protein